MLIPARWRVRLPRFPLSPGLPPGLPPTSPISAQGALSCLRLKHSQPHNGTSSPPLTSLVLSGVPGAKAGLGAPAGAPQPPRAPEVPARESLVTRLLKKVSDRYNTPEEPSESLTSLIKLAKPETKPIAISFALLLVSSAVTLSVPLTLGYVVDIFSGHKTDLPVSLPVLSAAVVAILSVGAAVNVVRYILLRDSGIRIIGRLRADVYNNLLRMDSAWFDLYKTKDMSSDPLVQSLAPANSRRTFAPGPSRYPEAQVEQDFEKLEKEIDTLRAEERELKDEERQLQVQSEKEPPRDLAREPAKTKSSSRSGTVADIVSRLITDASTIGNCLTGDLADAARALVLLVSALCLMIAISPQMTLVMLITVPLISVAAFLYGQYVKKLSFRLQSALGDLQSLAQSRLSAIRTIQSFNAAFPFESSQFRSRLNTMTSIQFQEARVSGFFSGGMTFSGYMTMLGLVSYGGLLVSSSSLSFGSLTSLLMYALYIGSNATVVMNFVSKLMMTLGASSRVFALIRAEPVSVFPAQGKHIPKLPVARDIHFDKISFSYPSRPDIPILRDFSLKIKPGTSVAFAGSSGSGKSTIGLLLGRFYDPSQGIIRYGQDDIKSFTPESWRTQFAYVSQEPVLFDGTVTDNIRYGDPTAPLEKVYRAAELANCDFVHSFPDGFDTHVGPSGSQLSGGQRQRISIARALLTEAPVLIADEATSALDVSSETIVNDSLRKIHEQSPITVIIIAHRLSTLRSAETIVYVKDGQVKEVGSFEQLVKPGTQFSDFIKSQFQL